MYELGAVDFATAAIGPEESTEVVQLGLIRTTAPDGTPVVLGVRGSNMQYGQPECRLEVVTADRAVATATRERIEELMAEHDILRGQVMAFGISENRGNELLTFLPRPNLRDEDVVLPDGVLDSIERHTVGIARHGQRLLAAGQHLKRGLLLHGPPGTGKTHTVRYLMGRLPESTVIVLTGTAMQFVHKAATLARRLQPSVVVLEDVDLIAQDRSHGPMMGSSPLLFTLLDAMDGVGGDVTVETTRGDINLTGGSGVITLKSIQGEVTVQKAKGRIEVRAVNEGMHLSDISGDLSAETTNGSIILDRIDSANVDLYAVNGNISFDGPIKDKGLYRLTTHNGLVAMAVPEKANVTLMVRTYNGGVKSTFQVPGDTGERRKRFTMTLGNGSAHVELESFGGTISLRRPGEPRPETERRQRRDKADIKLDLKGLAHLDIDQTVREALAEAEAAMPQAIAEAQAAIPEALAEAQAAIPQAIEEAMASIPEAMEQAMRELEWAFPFAHPNPRPNPSPRPNRKPNPNPQPNPQPNLRNR